jgi:hypothetical protein
MEIKTTSVHPEVLTHPNIPKPLHGVNPRTIMGKKWWDEHRKVAYASNNFRCYACGIKKENAKPRPLLEAHEFYEINYETGLVEMKFLIPLCPTCHQFIHSGRTWALYQKGEVPLSIIRFIIRRGMKILRNNSLSPFYFTRMVEMNIFDGIPMALAFDAVKDELPIPTSKVPWNEWRLHLDGKDYYSLFPNKEEWSKAYNMQPGEHKELDTVNNLSTI